jgi:hypothetical protein
MVRSFPPGFRNQDIGTDGATIHVDFSGQGPAVVMLHGFADTGDMWAALATELVTDHTVIVPDLRGMGSRFTRQVVTTRRRWPMRSRASWNELSANAHRSTRRRVNITPSFYARPGATHSTLEQSAAFHQDAIDNKVYAAKGKLNMPVLAIGDPSARPWRTTCASLPRTSLGRLFQIPDIG